jgi:hypothetical protein
VVLVIVQDLGPSQRAARLIVEEEALTSRDLRLRQLGSTTTLKPGRQLTAVENGDEEARNST